MTDREAGMTDGEIPIQSQSVRFREGGIGRGHGILLLYPDKLAAVDSSAELWGMFLGPIVLVAISLLVHDILALGAAAAVLVGGWIGQGIGKRRAARKVAARRDGVRVIPLELITSLQIRKSTGFDGWLSGQALLVTTADGAEYEFRGRMNGWQAGALTVRGRDVHLTPQGITVRPRATPEPG
jgi:hypothetical protein